MGDIKFLVLIPVNYQYFLLGYCHLDTVLDSEDCWGAISLLVLSIFNFRGFHLDNF